MVAALSVLLAVATAAEAPPPEAHVIQLTERRDAALIVAAPFGTSARIDTSTLLTTASQLFSRRTDLRLLSAQQVGIDESRLLACPAEDRAGCWRRTALESPAAMLVIVTIVPGEARDSVVLFGVELATDRRIEIGPLMVSDTSASFEDLFMTELHPFLEAAGALRDYGEVRVDTDCLDCEVHVGEMQPRPITPGTNLLMGVPNGRAAIVVTRQDAEICTHDIAVESTSLAAIRCTLPATSSRTLGITVASGSAAVVGTTLLVWSSVLASGSAARVCFGMDTANCDLGGTPRSGGGVRTQPTRLSEANGGVPLVLIGSALVASGLVTLAGTMLLEEDQWWWAVVAGVTSGFGVAATVLAVD